MEDNRTGYGDKRTLIHHIFDFVDDLGFGAMDYADAFDKHGAGVHNKSK